MFLIKSERDQLLTPLSTICGIVERRHTLAILSNVLIEKKDDSLTFLATDIEIEARSRIGKIEGDGDGSVTVSARKLQDILRAFPEGTPVTLNVEEHRLIVKAGRSRFNLQTLPAENFPLMAENTGEKYRLTLPQKVMRQLIAQTQFAMANQDVRYFLNGLLLLIDGETLKACATDGHRLAHAGILTGKNSADGNEDPAAEKAATSLLPEPAAASQAQAQPQATINSSGNGNDGHHEVILPRKTVIELNRLLSDNDDPIDIEFSGNQVRFSFGDVRMTSKLIDGKFPDYKRVIPADVPSIFKVRRADFLQALQRAKILTNEKFNGVRLLISDNSLRISAANAEQEEAVEEIEINYQGETLDVGFNINYLLDLLNNTQSDEIEWHFNANGSSNLIRIPGDPNFMYVVMPMRI